MLTRIEIGLQTSIRDVQGENIARKIRNELNMSIDRVRMLKVYTVTGLDQEEVERVVAIAALHDPVLHVPSLRPLADDFDWVIEVGFRPGVTDNEGRTAKESLVTALGIPENRCDSIAVYTATQYMLTGDLDRDGILHIAKDLLANELIQRFQIASHQEWTKDPGFPAQAARVTGQASDRVETIPLADCNDEGLMELSRSRTLALSLKEMRLLKAHFTKAQTIEERKQQGLPANPTDAELECLAQTWSEHCKHKIFNATIDYTDTETGKRTTITSLYKTFVQGSTKTLRERMGTADFCLSVFKDNAGVVRFDDSTNVCIKVETHNSPSALDPYGGALTGIVGVNRDPMGTGMGANLLCNTDVFCFASPFYDKEIPPRLLHPRRVLEGVREGVEHGGNKSGIPTVNGAILFDERYLGKPLVFCGTIGTMPKEVKGHPSEDKKALPGDKIVMTGGRIGKDGIHGATFSSEELHEGSPATAVQIGDPITQRKMYDFLMRARDLGLYNAITDNGAGGLSSSVGEMAQECGGCNMDLQLAPLKYDGLDPWEILISEAQERMTLAVPPENLETFLSLAKEMDVEATALGEFQDSGVFHVRYGERTICYMDMDFLHDGAPRMELSAVWKRPELPVSVTVDPASVGDGAEFLGRMLARPNICSKEYVIRQYDHEVQGGSVIKPLVGDELDGPGDAGVVRPVLGSNQGLVISNGICPKYSDLDTYWMMANCIDEAIRNAVAVGGDIRHMAGIDNFCWCDPVQSEKTPDGEYKLAQLVRANQALAHFCIGYGVPCISGKDSMKNDYTAGTTKISIPPTVLFSVMGVIPDIEKCQTSDFKAPDELIYILGLTRAELGGSEFCSELGIKGGQVPQVDLISARNRYLAMFEAVRNGYVTSCHDLSDGGLGVAAAEMAIGGRIGAQIDLDRVPFQGTFLSPEELLYSESASRFLVTVKPEHRTRFERCFSGQSMAWIGQTVPDRELSFFRDGKSLFTSRVGSLAKAWQSTLDF
ncbi:AIR synthase-related protein [Desulfoplanes sp.]